MLELPRMDFPEENALIEHERNIRSRAAQAWAEAARKDSQAVQIEPTEQQGSAASDAGLPEMREAPEPPFFDEEKYWAENDAYWAAHPMPEAPEPSVTEYMEQPEPRELPEVPEPPVLEYLEQPEPPELPEAPEPPLRQIRALTL